MDMYEGKEREDREHMLVHDLQNTMAYLPWAPVIFGSGLERRNIFHILEQAVEIQEQRKRVVSQGELNVWLQMALDHHPPKGLRGKHKFSVLGVKQDGTEPPTFVFSCNWPEIMHFSYGRYLENEFREQFGFIGTPVRFIFRKPGERAGHRQDKMPKKELTEIPDDDFFEEQ
jgi:GTP-binding protein